MPGCESSGMNSDELKATAHRFLAMMMMDHKVLADVQAAPEGPGGAKLPGPIGEVMAKTLGIPKPTDDEVVTMGEHMRQATAGLRDALASASPEVNDAFSAANICILRPPGA